MSDFEKNLIECRSSVESYVRYKLPSKQDADDVLQEIYLTAFRRFDTLSDISSFKPWLISIARSKCADWFRSRVKICEISLDTISDRIFTRGRMGISESNAVRDTLDSLGSEDRQILYLYYFREIPQSDIASRLNIPLGTVKSRLYNAKHKFKNAYPYKPKGSNIMSKLPETMPDYKIERTNESPFPVRWEETMGWFIIPREGEKLNWAMYDFPLRKRTEYDEMEVIGRCEIHGIEGVEIVARQYEASECNRVAGQNPVERHLFAQLTDTHCRFLAESHFENGVKKLYTFLDGDAFLDNWGFGENNCGNEVELTQKGDIVRTENGYSCKNKKYAMDVTGCCKVTIGGKSYDTICVVDCFTYCGEGIASEQYIDRNGRTVLWRRFNRDDWAKGKYCRLWSEMLPDNEQIKINSDTYVHWYDCVTDYIF